MPIYEYACAECGGRFERLVRGDGSGSEVACPACGSVTVDRIISAPAVRSDATRAASAAAARQRRADHRSEVGASERDPTRERHDDH